MTRLQNSRPSNAFWHAFWGKPPHGHPQAVVLYTAEIRITLRSAVEIQSWTRLQNARPRKACLQELFRPVRPRRHPQAVVLNTAKLEKSILQCCRDTHQRHACRMLGTGIAGKSYFGKTGWKRASVHRIVRSFSIRCTTARRSACGTDVGSHIDALSAAWDAV